MKHNSLRQVSEKETEVILGLFLEQLKVPGDAVEFGCYRGDTSLILQRELEKAQKESNDEDLRAKRLWLYDSFEGLPARTKEDASVAGDAFQAGELKVSKNEVILRFKKAGLFVPRVRKGFFEELNPEKDLPEKISFAFLDGDLYQSIKTSLMLVTPRMVEDGVILVHDYNNPELPGAARAVDEWLAAHKKRLAVRETLAIIR